MASYSTPYYNRVRSRRAGSARPTTSMQAQPTAPQDKYLTNLDYNDVLGGLNQGLSSYAQGAADTYDFSVDPYAGYKGSAQGLASSGPLGAILGGIGGQLGTFSQVNKNLRGLSTSVDLTAESATGQPVYAGGAYVDTQNKIDALDEGEQAIKGSLDPATRLFSGALGTRKRIRRKRREIEERRMQAQQEYNIAAEQANQRALALSDYYKRSDIRQRLYNLYRN